MEDYLEELKNDHSNFRKDKLDHPDHDNPFDQFDEWFKEAFNEGVTEVNACVLSTVSPDQEPSSRIVYLKELIDEQFVFYSNYKSEKGRHLESNPNASMLFFWKEKERQIRISGTVEKIAPEISDAYFKMRPRESQLGAWASSQSEVLNTREELEMRLDFYSKEFTGEVPRPEHWGGYALNATKVEFWQGRVSRLHDRIVYEKDDSGKWEIYRLNP